MTTTTTRRNIVKGTAWAIPAVTIAAAAPATAASCVPTVYTVTGSVGYQDVLSSDDPDFAILLSNTGKDPIPAGTVFDVELVSSVQGWDQSVAAPSIERYETSIDHYGSANATIEIGDASGAANYIDKNAADGYYEAGRPDRVERTKSTRRHASATITTGSNIPANPGAPMRIAVWIPSGSDTSLFFKPGTYPIAGSTCGDTLVLSSYYTEPASIIPADQYTPPTTAATPTPTD